MLWSLTVNAVIYITPAVF